jgi:hypothetical protein
MMHTPKEPWPFARSLRFSAMGLLVVVLSTFAEGSASMALLATAAILTMVAVVCFLGALRKERAGLATDAKPGKVEPASKDRV